MYIQQFYTNCLSQAAYYIESNGEAAIIDPLRDIDAYLILAKQRNTTIRYIFETHFHADFVSGHLDLSKTTGAAIIYGPNTITAYPVHVANDGDTFALGELSIAAVYTPGHTIESTCWLLKDAAGKDYAIFTGDTLFIGDVGRPDLSSGELDSEALAALLYDSLQQKIVPLADDVLVYPAHGAGSACGKNLGPETFSTIGQQKATNYALQATDKVAFIEAVTAGLTDAPAYFAINARINQQGYTELEKLLVNGLVPLSPTDFFDAMQSSDIVVLDTRPATLFTQGFVTGSISIGLDGRFAEWAGSLLPFDKTLLLVTETGQEQETITRLARVGFDQFGGFLAGSYEAWVSAGLPTDLIIDVAPDELAMDIPFDDKLLVVDVRKATEFAEGHVEDALLLPLNDLTDAGNIAQLPETANLYVHCAGGYRSVIACSLLKRQGYHNLRNVLGGWKAISELPNIPKEKDASVLN